MWKPNGTTRSSNRASPSKTTAVPKTRVQASGRPSPASLKAQIPSSDESQRRDWAHCDNPREQLDQPAHVKSPARQHQPCHGHHRQVGELGKQWEFPPKLLSHPQRVHSPSLQAKIRFALTPCKASIEVDCDSDSRMGHMENTRRRRRRRQFGNALASGRREKYEGALGSR